MKKLLFKKVLLVKGGLSQVGCPFLGGLRSEWMKSGHGGRGGQKRPKMGGRPLYTVPYAPNLFPKIFHLAEGTEYSRPFSFCWKRQPEHR